MAGAELSPIVLTAADVATMLQVDTETVEKLARRGKLAKVRFMGQMRFRRSDVEDFIAKNTKPCRHAAENSPGLEESPERKIGTSTGTTAPAGQSADARRAHQMIEKLTRNSGASSPPEPKPPRIKQKPPNRLSRSADVLPFERTTAS